MDDYASVTWSNTGSRLVCIGWMNNQAYSGAYPVSPWRSCMTLPREMVLEEYNGQPLLKTTIVKEIEGIADGWQTVASRKLDVKDAYQLNVTVDMSADCDILLSNAHGEEYGLHVDSQRRDLVINRGAKTGLTDFSGNFPITSMRSSLFTDHQQVTLCIYVDQSNVEVTTDDGSVIMSTLVFPQSLYDQVVISGQKAKAQVRNLRRVWE